MNQAEESSSRRRGKKYDNLLHPPMSQPLHENGILTEPLADLLIHHKVPFGFVPCFFIVSVEIYLAIFLPSHTDFPILFPSSRERAHSSTPGACVWFDKERIICAPGLMFFFSPTHLFLLVASEVHTGMDCYFIARAVFCFASFFTPNHVSTSGRNFVSGSPFGTDSAVWSRKKTPHQKPAPRVVWKDADRRPRQSEQHFPWISNCLQIGNHVLVRQPHTASVRRPLSTLRLFGCVGKCVVPLYRLPNTTLCCVLSLPVRSIKREGEEIGRLSDQHRHGDVCFWAGGKRNLIALTVWHRGMRPVTQFGAFPKRYAGDDHWQKSEREGVRPRTSGLPQHSWESKLRNGAWCGRVLVFSVCGRGRGRIPASRKHPSERWKINKERKGNRDESHLNIGVRTGTRNHHF